MKAGCIATWVALALIAASWACRLAWITVPALDDAGKHAAEALYLAELEQQLHAVPVTVPTTIESIATEVHRRASRLLIWIALGLGLCLMALLSPRSRSSAAVASGLVFLVGWIELDAYAQVGLLQGLDLKLRLVQADGMRLLRFAVVDAVLPLVVAGAVAAIALAALRRA